MSARVDLISSLLREAESVGGEDGADSRKLGASGDDLALSGGRGMALGVDDGDGPQTRRLDPARAVTRWYRRGRTGLEELLLQLYFGHLSLAEVESVVTTLWGAVDGAALIREVVPEVIERIERWITAPVQQFHPYIFLHSVEYRCRRITEASGMRIAAAVGINQLGYREFLGVVAVPSEAPAMWESLLAALVARGVRPPRMIVGETGDDAMRAAVARRWKSCGFLMPLSELERELLREVGPADFHWVDQSVSKLKACVNRADGERVGLKLRDQLKKAGYSALSVDLGERLHRHLACFEISQSHRLRLRGANLGRTELNRAREQARVIGPINDEKTMVLLVAATFRAQGRSSWNSKPFLPV